MTEHPARDADIEAIFDSIPARLWSPELRSPFIEMKGRIEDAARRLYALTVSARDERDAAQSGLRQPEVVAARYGRQGAEVDTALAKAWYPAISYKPGWAFSWKKNAGLWLLQISCSAPEKQLDSLTGEDRGRYSIFLLPPQPFNPLWLLEALTDIEEHERREWLRVDGERVFNPHVWGEPDHMALNRSEWPNEESEAALGGAASAAQLRREKADAEARAGAAQAEVTRLRVAIERFMNGSVPAGPDVIHSRLAFDRLCADLAGDAAREAGDQHGGQT